MHSKFPKSIHEELYIFSSLLRLPITSFLSSFLDDDFVIYFTEKAEAPPHLPGSLHLCP